MKLLIWKFGIQSFQKAGAEQFDSLSKSYFQNTTVAIVVYDITNEKTFQHVGHWIKQLEKYAPSEVTKMLIGNKIDEESKYHN